MNPYQYGQWQNYYNTQIQKLQQLVRRYENKMTYLEGEIHRLTTENQMLRDFLDKAQSPIQIQNLYLSHDINLDQLRINSIQSGSALNIGEHISNTTNSDMDMKMGSNSMNSGDANHMGSYGKAMLANTNSEKNKSINQ
jgi:predicted RNase H-like nuclease (RuvC/YqgF family)